MRKVAPQELSSLHSVGFKIFVSAEYDSEKAELDIYQLNNKSGFLSAVAEISGGYISNDEYHSLSDLIVPKTKIIHKFSVDLTTLDSRDVSVEDLRIKSFDIDKIALTIVTGPNKVVQHTLNLRLAEETQAFLISEITKINLIK